ncbi:hypothetical protein WICPIJ_001292 [Wickerhamomyces pijperi]|uniref:Uncharacterized protein n=1 Tax=Wickerhamomyces pijperi TaxID=599730 RepID=A0A9P8TRB7_WICPI|nr:hypothetical protein WICPIJ_001292 [Wickerhamomyces pijperi]
MSTNRSPLKSTNKPTLTAKTTTIRLLSPERRSSPSRIVPPALGPATRSPNTRSRSASPPSRIASALGSPSRINSKGIKETPANVSPVRGASLLDRKHFNMSLARQTRSGSPASSASSSNSNSSSGKPPRLSYGEMSGNIRIVKHVPSKMVSGKRKLAPVQQSYKKTPQSHSQSSANTTINTDSSMTMNSSFNGAKKKKDPSMNLLDSFKSTQKSILKKSDHASSSMITEDNSSDSTDATTKLNTIKNKVTKRPLSRSNRNVLEDPEITQPRKKRVVVFDEDTIDGDEEPSHEDVSKDEEGASFDAASEKSMKKNDQAQGQESGDVMVLFRKILDNQKLMLERQDKILERVEGLEKSLENLLEK